MDVCVIMFYDFYNQRSNRQSLVLHARGSSLYNTVNRDSLRSVERDSLIITSLCEIVMN